MSTEIQVIPPAAGQVATQSFGGGALEARAETSSAALAAQARAQVEARYVVAIQRPRDLMVARQRLLDDCRRFAFAERAIYRKPVGQGVEGPSIRLAEAAARALGNIFTDVIGVYDDREKRIVRIICSDLESNLTFTKDVTIAKVVERRNADGRKVISQRVNSRGQTTFLIEATDDELLDRENALVSKAMRTCLLRLVPGDLLDEALDVARETLKTGVDADPNLARKKCSDAYASLGIGAVQLGEYLGHSLDTATPDEVVQLRKLYATLRDGETKWNDVMEARRPAPAQVTDSTPPASLNEAAENKQQRQHRQKHQ